MKSRKTAVMVISFFALAALIAGLYLFWGPFPAVEQEKGHSQGQSAPASDQDQGAATVVPHTAINGAENGQAVMEAQPEAANIEIPESGQRYIGVQTVAAEKKSLVRTIRTVGRFEYDERKIVTVNTRIEGWIERLKVNYTGRYVKKGEVLAEIYSPELVAAQQEYLNILKWSRRDTAPSSDQNDGSLGRMLALDAEAMRQAARQRLMFWDITEAQLKKIEESGTPLRTLAVFSPVSGYALAKSALQGMKVQAGERLFDLVDTSTVWLLADVYEQDIALVGVGQKAEISTLALPGRVFASVVEYVSPVLAGETRTAKIRFTLPNKGGQLKPQMFADVGLKVNLGSRLVVPDAAIISTGVRQLVYVDKGEGYFEPREVRVGLKAEGLSEIIAGLAAGEKVASAATFLIDSEARLKGVVK